MPFKPTADSETRRRAQQTLFTLSNLPVAHVVVDDKDPLVSRSKQIETFAKSVPVLLVDYSPAEKSLRFIFPSVADRTKGVREAWSSGLILQATTRTAKEWELTERLALVRPKYRRFFVRQLDPFGPDFDPDRLLVHFPLIGQAWRSLVAAVEAKGSGFYAADAYSPLPPPAPRPPGRMFPEPPAKPTLNLTTAAPRSNTFSLSRVLGQLSAGHAASSSAVAPAQQLPDAARRLEEEFERVQKELEQWKRAHGEVETEIIVSRERHALKVKEKEDDIEAQKREIVTLQRANADLTRAIDSLKERLARQVEGAALEERLARQGKDGKGLSDLLPMQGAVGAGSAAPAASLLVPRPDTLATGAAAAQRALAPSGRPEGPSVSDKSSAMDLDESPPPIAATPGTTVSRAPLALDSHPNVTVACIEPAAAKTTTSASAEEGTATMMTVSGRDDEGVGGAGESDQTGGEQDEQGRASTTRDKNQKGEISEGGVRQVFEELRALKPSDEGGERSALLPSTHDAADVAVRPDGRNDSRNNNDTTPCMVAINPARQVAKSATIVPVARPAAPKTITNDAATGTAILSAEDMPP
ncbi:uncharacterized protein JCM10292_004207 [Rhodotorula paludigena]|uniref:uncharacterized protein n=1 Tax=Rhodotorula paludigena TaxID=86838 RepID=UPI00316C0074